MGRVVWVTGASTGIGFDIAKTFAKAGYTVIATARRKSRLVALVKELKFAGYEAYAFVCDALSERSIISTKKKILEKCGTIDILINNAGVTTFKSFLDTKPPEFDNILETNLRGSYLATRTILPLLIKKRKGHIINILSVTTRNVFTNSSAYAASKAGMLAMFDVLRAEVRKFNIKVSNIVPGAVDTAMWSQSSRQRYSKRMMTTKEVAEIVLAVANQPKKVVLEEVLIRPIKGDL